MSTPTSEEAPPYASFFGSMGSAAAIIFTGTADIFHHLSALVLIESNVMLQLIGIFVQNERETTT